MIIKSICAFSVTRGVFIKLGSILRAYSTSAGIQQMDVNIMAENSSHIVWMDLEMTGLDVNKDKIIEVCCLITDKDLNIVSEGPCLAINYPKELFDNMGKWCMKHHNKSGLVERCLKSGITCIQAGNILLDYLKANVPIGKCPLAGNSVYMDRIFLKMNWPAVDEYLHYRIIDVSTIKELVKRWNPRILENAPAKKFAHRSLDDVKDSIEELRFYKSSVFKQE